MIICSFKINIRLCEIIHTLRIFKPIQKPIQVQIPNTYTFDFLTITIILCLAFLVLNTARKKKIKGKNNVYTVLSLSEIYFSFFLVTLEIESNLHRHTSGWDIHILYIVCQPKVKYNSSNSKAISPSHIVRFAYVGNYSNLKYRSGNIRTKSIFVKMPALIRLLWFPEWKKKKNTQRFIQSEGRAKIWSCWTVKYLDDILDCARGFPYSCWLPFNLMYYILRIITLLYSNGNKIYLFEPNPSEQKRKE